LPAGIAPRRPDVEHDRNPPQLLRAQSPVGQRGSEPAVEGGAELAALKHVEVEPGGGCGVPLRETVIDRGVGGLREDSKDQKADE
jgi:hypothetical protein